MRVLFIPAAVASHHYPMVPLAWAFRTAGHEVCVAGQPVVIDSIVRSGLTAVSVGGSYDLMAGISGASEMVRRETGRVPNGAAELAALPPDVRRRYVEMRKAPHLKAAEAMAGDLIAYARTWRPDLVVTDPATMVGPLLADVLEIPLIHHLWGPQPPSVTKFPGYGAPVQDWPSGVREMFARFGATPRPDYSLGTVDPCPPSLQPVSGPNRLVSRYLSYNGSGAVPQWLRVPADRPRVCVSWMTTDTEAADGTGRHPVAALAEALATLDVEVVITVRASDRAALGPAPDGVRLVEDIPLHMVLPTCAVSVNHGGAGTMLSAACAGVPQVIVPQNPAHDFNAERISAVGAGTAFRAHEIDIEAMAATVASMMTDDTWRKAARSLREENLALPAPAEVLRTIVDLL
jgi:UDP:flavonoid glycosyltransferase YjiC (YdhE family)